jgi:predicted amidohydrolase
VVAADGSVSQKADDAEGILYADVDLSASHQIRKGKPYTSLRRREFYL